MGTRPETFDGVNTDAARHRAVLVGASLGGGEALRVLLGGLRTDLPVPVVIAQRLDPGVIRPHTMPGRVLRRAVVRAEDGRVPEAGLCPWRTWSRTAR